MEDNPYKPPAEDNPYRTPMFSDLPNMGEAPELQPTESSPSEAELRTFVGRNANYYLRKWAPALHDSRPVRGFNWAAFGLFGLWLGYRKMYRVALIAFGIIGAETVFEELAIGAGFVSEQQISALSRLVGLAVWIVCGMYSNAWYLAHAKRQIAKIRASGLKGDAYREALTRRGGTSLVASFGLFLLFLVTLAVAGIAVELFFPSD
jgi:hypothetical protein